MYCKVRDKECYTNTVLQLIKTFLRGVWVSNSELLDVYIRTEKNIYVVDNESPISHCQRKKLEKREEKARMN